MSTVAKSTERVSGFTPQAIPGLALWLDGADINTLTFSGSNVTQWRDKSGNTRHANANVAGTYASNAVVFNGANYYTVAGSSNLLASTYFSIFVVERIAPSAGSSFLIAGNSQSFINGGSFHMGYRNLTTFTSAFWNNDVDATSGFSGTGAIRIWTMVLPSWGNRFIGLNGTLRATHGNNTFMTGMNALQIGAAFAPGTAGTNFYPGSIYEFVVFTSDLVLPQIGQMEGYLARKWGLIGSLPSPTTHSHSFTPPFLRQFSPTDIDTCVLWVDGADASTVTLTGSNITQWRDKSGNGNNGTGTGTLGYTSNAINGLNAVSFTAAVNSYIRGGVSITGTTYTAFAVGTLSASSTNDARLLSLGTVGVTDFGTAASSAAILRSSSGQTLYTYRNNVGTTAAAVTYDVPFIAGSLYDGTNMTMLVNGTGPSRTSAGTFNIAAYQIGSSFTEEATLRYSGFVGEVLIYNTALSAVQRQQVEGYLAKKWRLQANLASTHLQRFVPPLTPVFHTPLQISGCALWLDGADASSMTLSGTSVTQWRDKSGGGRSTTAVTGTPTLTSNSLNSLSGVYFNGSQDMTGPFVHTTNRLTYFIVSTTEATSTNYARTLAIGTAGTIDWNNTGSMACLARETGVNSVYFQRNSSAVNISGQTYATPFLFSAVLNGATATAFLNGTQGGSMASVGNFSTNIYTLSTGLPTSGNLRNRGFIYEILVYTTSLTLGQRQQIEGYLAWKWGRQTSLPASHLYSKVRP